MRDHDEIVEKGRAALLAGDVRREGPPREGGRWGLAALLRPDPAMLATLADFGAVAAETAGGGHWEHGIDGLHVSLVPLEPYREVVGDISPYVAVLREAVAGLPVIRADVRTVSPHSLGVAVHVHPRGGTLDLLDRRFADLLDVHGLGAYPGWTRDIWYSNVVHFAGPVDVPRLVAWADTRRDTEFGVTTLSSVDLVRYHFTGKGMRAESLHRQDLGN